MKKVLFAAPYNILFGVEEFGTGVINIFLYNSMMVAYDVFPHMNY